MSASETTLGRGARGRGLLMVPCCVMVLCCAFGPAFIGAAAGGALGGWLGIACAVILAATVAMILQRRRRNRGPC
ncbi:MAG: hypothetical protein LC713_02550 [Actinobacteria bacterium]|nr:hypothetical protein [Actinomycetota bacterium]